MRRARWLVVGRAVSAGGDVVLRITAAAAAAGESRSTLLTGLVLVGPAIAGLLLRGRLFRRFQGRFAEAGAAVELLRAALFALLAVRAPWAAVIAALVLAGGLQAIFDGAFGALLGRCASDATAARALNAWLRVAVLLSTVGGALLAGALHLSLRTAALLDAATFLISACTVLAARSVAQGEPPPVAAPAPLEIGAVDRGASGRAYVGATIGLALAAPSIVTASAAALASWPVAVDGAYAIYQGAVYLGSFAGGLLSLTRRAALGRTAIALAVAGMSSLALVAAAPFAATFLLLTAVSALAETVLVVDLQTRAQTELGPTECAEFLLRLRTALAIVAAAGLAGNLLLAPHLAPLQVVAIASAVGGLAGLVAQRLTAQGAAA